MMMKPAPEAVFTAKGERYRETCVPSKTATKLLTSSASADAANTPKRLRPGSVAKRTVAICVLSPNSARKTLRKTVKKDLIIPPDHTLLLDIRACGIKDCNALNTTSQRSLSASPIPVKKRSEEMRRESVLLVIAMLLS